MRSEVLAGSLLRRRIAVSCWVCVVLLLGPELAIARPPGHDSVNKVPTDISRSSQRKAEQLRSEALQLMKRGKLEDLTSAMQFLRQGATTLRLAGLGSSAASYYLSIGEIYFIWSRYKEAIRAYRFGLSLSAESDYSLRCSFLSHIAITYQYSGKIQLSDNYAHQAMQMAGRSGKPEDRAKGFLALGLSSLYSNSLKEALKYFHDAIEIFQANDDIEAQAETSLYQGWALGQEGSTQEALIQQQDGLRLWTSTGNAYGMAQAHSALGFLWDLMGEPDKALADYEAAKGIFHSTGDRNNEAIVLNGLGRVSQDLGDYESSLRYFLQAKVIFTRTGDSVGALVAIAGAARAHWSLQHYPQAKVLYGLELKRASWAKHYNFETDALANIADLYALEHKYRLAQNLKLRALKLCRSGRDTWGEIDILISLGQLYAETGQPQNAERSLQDAFKLAEFNGEVSRQARAHYELARLYESLHQVDQAKIESEKTVQIIELERTKVSDFDSRATYFASVHDYYQLYIHVLMELDKQHPGQGFAQRAFEAAERSKVRSLLDMLASSQANSECDKHNEPDQRVREAEIAVKDNGCHPAPSALSLRQIQEEIRGDDAVLLEYALGPQASYLWAVDQEHIAAYPLPGSEQILRLARLYRTALMARQPIVGETAEHYDDRVTRADHEISGIAQELSGLLLTPAADYLHGKRRVIVVSEGPLQYIPFAALPFENSPALAANYEVVTLPSFSILKELRDGAAKRPPPTQAAAVFADPVFSKDDERVSQSLAADRHPAPIMLATALRDVQFGSANIPRLRGSRKEAEDILNAFSSNQVLESLDFDASLKTVLSADLQQYRYLHFATHGVLDAAHPEFSGLILSLVNSKGEPEDGYLRLRDIYNLKLSADLVVLSSCDSALGKDLQSEGIIGLPRAFLYAGAERVISSLWKVDDQATAAFMQHFYSHIHAGDSPASALRATQSELASDSRWSKPYYWAGFILQGEYR